VWLRHRRVNPESSTSGSAAAPAVAATTDGDLWVDEQRAKLRRRPCVALSCGWAEEEQRVRAQVRAPVL